MEELKEIVKTLEGADVETLKDLTPKIMEKIKEVGYVEVMTDPNLKDLIPKMREKMASIDIEELVPLANVVIPTLFEGMSILIENSEEAKEELEDMDDIKINLTVPELDTSIFIKIEGGKFKAGSGLVEEPDLTILIGKEAFIKLLQGQSDMMSAYMAGEIKLEGDMVKVMALGSLFEIFADEYGIDIGIGV